MKKESRTKKRRDTGAKNKHKFPMSDFLAREDFNIGDNGPVRGKNGNYRTPNMVFAAYLLSLDDTMLEGVEEFTVGDTITKDTRIKYRFILSYDGEPSMGYLWKLFLNDKTTVEPNTFNSNISKLRQVMHRDVQSRQRRSRK